jgi:L-threonylcarbamoyladenylate synthase
MITLNYPFAGPEKHKNLELVASVCRRGGIVVYPTETFYAIGGNALDRKLGERLSRVKKRPPDKPFPTIVGNCSNLKKLVASWPGDSRQLATAFWPGALTMILPGRDHLPAAITGEQNSIAVRWSSHPLIGELAAFADCPLISTSANLSRQPPVQKAAELTPEMLAAADMLIVADNDNPDPAPSTIIDARTTPPLILRPGAVEIA